MTETKSPVRFALIGAAGYIAPRHLQAIQETGNRLLCAMDPCDSVGILDRFFSDVDFFTEFERFDRHAEKLRRLGEAHRIEWVSICSPNHLHDAHIRFGMRMGAHVICEKPVVLNPWNADAIEELSRESGTSVNVVLQLRLHPSIQALREKLHHENANAGRKHEVVLTYITSRGPWYDYSWKGDVRRSGGIATNIGIHFFDMLLWLFGPVEKNVLSKADPRKAAGFLELEKARVRWFLSLDRRDLPDEAVSRNQSTFRSILVDGEELEFSEGFTDLHTRTYEEALKGRGFSVCDARPSIELVHSMRCVREQPCNAGERHPMLSG